MSWWPFSKKDREEDRTLSILSARMKTGMTVFPMGEGSVTESGVAEIGKVLGVTFPTELVAHWSGQFPGTCVWVNEDIWPRPEVLQVGPFWTFLYGFYSYSPLSTSEDWMHLDLQGKLFRQKTGLHAAPILKLFGDADLYCVDRNGDIQQYDHESNTILPVDLNFWELFEREIAELADRMDRYVSEGLGNEKR